MSAPAITITLDGQTKALLARGAAATVLSAVAAALDEQNELTIGAAVAKRMSFPRGQKPTREGTRVLTGRLRQSLTRSKARISGGNVISAIGSNVRYFAVHEFGFQGTVNVRGHTRAEGRRFQSGDGSIISLAAAARAGALTKEGAARKAAGLTEIQGRTFTVRAYSMKLNFPARRMVGRTVEERVPDYNLAIQAKVTAVLPGGAT